MIVMKFGGTSVGSTEMIQQVGDIVRSRLERYPLIVVSAMAKTTDHLEQLCQIAVDSPDTVPETVEKITAFHQRVIDDLHLLDDAQLQTILESAGEQLIQISQAIHEKNQNNKQLQDALLSVGEYISSNVLARYLTSIGIEAVMADARGIMVTDSQFGRALPQIDESTDRAKKEILPIIEKGIVPVMQGFIGRSQDGLITTLGRGGSDYSATLMATMLEAEAVEIWTDVDGVMTADPTIISDVKRIKKMTFQEAAELAYFGARVLHPATILPAVERGIPVYVLNTMRPADSGTEILPITEDRKSNHSLVKSVVYKEGLTVVTIKSTRMLMAYGFMANVFEIFNRYKTAVDLVSTSEVSVSITIDNTEHLNEIKKELSEFSEVDIQYGKAIVCVVGESIRKTHGMPAKIFSAIEDMEIHLISQGASEINISFVINESEIETVVRRLHEKFFSEPVDTNIFA